LSFIDEITEAQRVYKDILNGFSVFKKDGETFFIKHFTEIDHGWVQEYKRDCFERAKEKGLATHEEQLKLICDQKLWTMEKEKELDYWTMEISNLQVTRNKLVLDNQKKQVSKQIKEYEEKIAEYTEERIELMGLTCESFADKKVNEYYMFYSLYKDEDLKHKYYDLEDYEELPAKEVSEMVMLNNKILTDFSNKNLKKVAACPFFLNSVMISKSNPFVFFGKPIVKLTNYQQELWNNGVRFKSIIEQKNDTPPKMLTLQDVVDWYENASSSLSGDGSDKHKKEAEGGGVSYVGASKEEVKKMAESDKENVVSLGKAADDLLKKAKAKGEDKKVLSMFDMMKIHGELD